VNAPFTAPGSIVPVTVVTRGDLIVPPGAALVTLPDAAAHDHAGAECLVCATRGNVRVLLFELMEQVRLGAVPPPSAVVVDARRAADPRGVIDALVPGRIPAFGLRDHAVARAFRLTA
jgi:hypothetical protein